MFDPTEYPPSVFPLQCIALAELGDDAMADLALFCVYINHCKLDERRNLSPTFDQYTSLRDLE